MGMQATSKGNMPVVTVKRRRYRN
jgi:hypothetical protein